MHRALLPASSLAGLSRGGRRLFECGTPPALFARAHAPGAHLLPAEPTLKDPQGISLLSAAQFEALAAAMGLHAGSPAPVFYDDAGSVASARAAWVFRYWGVGGAQRCSARECVVCLGAAPAAGEKPKGAHARLTSSWARAAA